MCSIRPAQAPIALDPVAIQNGLAGQAGNSQYPTLHLSDDTLGCRHVGLRESREAAVVIGALKPGSDVVGVMLVTGARPRLHSLG
jgi:hypothetical protein